MDARAGLLIRYGGDFVDGVVARASGSFVETVDGRRVLDFTAGQICATVGHNHPRVVAAIEAACREVLHLNSWMLSEPVLALADRLVGTLPEPLRRVMLLSTGGEGIEAALRMAKLSSGRFEVAALTRSWHGVTAGASAVTYAAGRSGYGPATPGAFALPAPYAYRCPIRHCDGDCDCTCLEAGFDLFDQASVGSPAAVVAEPVLSAGGVISRRLATSCAWQSSRASAGCSSSSTSARPDSGGSGRCTASRSTAWCPTCSCCPRRWAGAYRSARSRPAPRSRRTATRADSFT